MIGVGERREKREWGRVRENGKDQALTVSRMLEVKV